MYQNLKKKFYQKIARSPIMFAIGMAVLLFGLLIPTHAAVKPAAYFIGCSDASTVCSEAFLEVGDKTSDSGSIYVTAGKTVYYSCSDTDGQFTISCAPFGSSGAAAPYKLTGLGGTNGGSFVAPRSDYYWLDIKSGDTSSSPRTTGSGMIYYYTN